MSLKFQFRKDNSAILGAIYRPVAKVKFWSAIKNYWLEVRMIVDTGADYTLLPRFLANDLGVDLDKQCKMFSASGIGGQEKVYLLKEIKVKLGKWERNIPVGFLDKDQVPPLLGRHKFMETFTTTFSKKQTVEFKS